MHSPWRKALITFLAPTILLSTGLLVSAKSHRVAAGDTLFLIAQRYGTTVEDLKSQNGLSGDLLYPGQILTVGRDHTDGGSGGAHVVQRGESLFLIASRYGTTVDALRAANGLSGDYIEAGQRLVIPSGSGRDGQDNGLYTVQPGDTLYLVAARNGTTVAAIMNANGLVDSTLYPGQQLRILSGGSGNGGHTGTQCTVKAGETLYILATRYGTTVSALRQANGLSSDTIYPGQTLIIPKGSGNQDPSPNISISPSDRELLARLVSAEAAGEPYAGQVAVAATILNRLRDPKYPNSIHGIIYQYTDGAYQYSPVMDGRINEPASSSAVAAVLDALKGWDPSYGATGFYNPAKTDNPWVRSQPVTTTIGDHVFFRY
ncbi:MAG: LysM peptidoglycan-binding domain-containing protein [Bacteroidota bacterium]